MATREHFTRSAKSTVRRARGTGAGWRRCCRRSAIAGATARWGGHDEAVRATLDWVEETFLETRGWDPETRRRPRVKAPFMAAVTFRHVASRNLDPQLRTHAVIANVTRAADGRWRWAIRRGATRSARSAMRWHGW